MESEKSDLKSILTEKEQNELINEQPQKQLRPSEWVEIRLFISSTFVDTHSERDLLIKKIIPELNQKLRDRCITIVPVDLRWGVFGERSKDCQSIQRTCLNEIDNCRQNKKTYPYFIGLRTQRYGWVQNVLLKKDGYENPQLFTWVEALDEHKKEVSITTLECIHGTRSTEEIPQAPTVFFYEREITNPGEIEEEFRWIFDLEYQSRDMGPQYTFTDKAEIYADDKKKLNEHLQSLKNVRYSKYKCLYEKGGARITGSKGDRKFGIGYVEGLDDFEKMVSEDLFGTIEKNFMKADISSFSEHELSNMQYEEAIKEKAMRFVGRPAHTEKIMKHCTAKNVDSSVLIVAGEPGRGKSAIMAYAANKCVEELRPKKDFVFVHGVDTCPQSNDLEQMLQRLHTSICIHVGVENSLKSSDDLKSSHVTQLEDIARNHPDQMFIIFVDAVNQLHKGMQARSMWWLPNKDSPNNLRVVVSTLLKENNTFENASERCPDAHIVNVEDMTKDESKEMVSSILARYNKRLTTDDSIPVLKNQMDLLIARNTSPLYLSVACEALRTEGVFEKMTDVIENLPKTVPELFSSLLEGWSEDYGSEFMKYLMCIITLSKDGLLENMISDILSYIEDKTQNDFQCSFSTVFSSIRGFLSSGGGGYLHFFHDQVNIVVKEKYLKPSPLFEAEVHDLLAEFYLQQIQPQLTEKPTSTPPLYYEDCLRHVVDHQVSGRMKNEQTADFSLTLRNIFYVREKIKAKQKNILQKEYLHDTMDETSLKALRNWRKFVNIYIPFIEELPQWSYNMAVNQLTSSYVYSDTKKLDIETEHNEPFPTYWVNKPSRTQDNLMLKYTSERAKICATTTVKENMVAVSGGMFSSRQFCVYDMTTSEIISRCHTQSLITFLSFSKDNQLLVGDDNGCVHICDITTGKVVWSSEKISEEKYGKVVWLQQHNDNQMCGTEKGTVLSICTTTKAITNTWKTGEETSVYSYQHTSELLYTGHDNSVKCWKLYGELVRSLDVNGKVKGLDVHPNKENEVVCCTEDSNYNMKVIQINMSNGEVIWEVEGWSERCYDVVYTHDGERLVYAEYQTLILLDGEGNTANKVKGHSSYIENIKLVPGTNQLLTAGEDGSYLFNLSTTPDQQHEGDDVQFVLSCALLNNRNEIILLKTGKEGKRVVDRCCGDTLKVVASAEVEGNVLRVIAHPTNNNIAVVSTKKDLLFLDTTTLETVVKNTLVSEGERKIILDLTICKDGTTCVVTVCSLLSSRVVVLDITNIDTITTLSTLKEGDANTIYSSDINNNGNKIVCGGDEGMDLYDVTTSKLIKTLRKEGNFIVRFVYQPEGVLFLDENFKLHLMNLDGVITYSFSGTHHEYSATSFNTSFIITGNKDSSIEVHDRRNGKTVYKFYHPSSVGFKGFVYQPEHNKLYAVNNGGKLYVLNDKPC